MKTIIIALLLAASSLASARIGETREQCIERYGKPLGPEAKGALLFSKAGFKIVVIFHAGKAEVIRIEKEQADALGIPAAMTEIEIDTVKEANGGGLAWHSAGGGFLERNWQTEGGTITASYHLSKNYLLILTREYLARSAAEADATQKENLKGF